MTQRDIDTAKSLATDFVDECLMELGVKAIAQALHSARLEGREEAAKKLEEKLDGNFADLVEAIRSL
jgi:hypothetical protein